MRGRLAVLAALASTLAADAAVAGYQMNMSPGVTPISRQVYDLHSTIMAIITVIFVGVFGVMFYSVFKFRRSKGAQAAQFHENTTVEVIWTVIPFVILVFMAWPATRTLLDMRDSSAPDMTLKVTGSQWKWSYDYVEEGFGFTSTLRTPLAQVLGQEPKGENYLLEVDNPVVVPVGKKVRVLLTAADVLHAWWVPALGTKQDAIPGFVRDTWFKAEKVGVYRGQCAELCGKDHGFMPIVVEVKSQEDYAAWVAGQKKKVAALADDPARKWELAALAARGEKVYQANCTACHQATGKGTPPAFPALDGSKVVNGPVRDQIALVLNGKPGTAMASFKQLSDTDLAAVVTYTRNAWGNKTGAVVQPSDVAAVRGGGALPAATPAAATPAAAAPGAAATATGGMPAKVYFETGKADFGKDGEAAIRAAVAYLQKSAGAKVDVTGFVDKTGNYDQNVELAKERAKAVRAALESAGISRDRINMKPPADIVGGADNPEARRVEINAAG